MIKIQKKEKSKSAVDVASVDPKRKPWRGIGGLIYPVLLISLGVMLVIFSAPRPLGVRNDRARSLILSGAKSFGHLKQLSSYFGKSLTVEAEGRLVRLEQELISLQSHRIIFGTPGFASRHPLSSRVLSFQSMRNPWDVFAGGAGVIGFDIAREELYTDLFGANEFSIDRPPQDAVLIIRDGRAEKFQPDQTGLSLDVPATLRAASLALVLGATSTEPVVISTYPTIRLGQTNSLGIVGLVAHGESDFHGSSKSRIHNIAVGASKFDGRIIKPEEEFSFNTYLGAVTKETGFLPELVIKTTGTVPEVGGGLCQVSTTAFRAALFGGLPITARRNHSYAVKYYAPQGTDATIYTGVQDMKFVNDTGRFILVHTYVDGTK